MESSIKCSSSSLFLYSVRLSVVPIPEAGVSQQHFPNTFAPNPNAEALLSNACTSADTEISACVCAFLPQKKKRVKCLKRHNPLSAVWKRALNFKFKNEDKHCFQPAVTWSGVLGKRIPLPATAMTPLLAVDTSPFSLQLLSYFTSIPLDGKIAGESTFTLLHAS